MIYRQMNFDGPLYVISVPSWMDWILPFLSDDRDPTAITCWELGAAVPIRLLASLHNTVVLLSHHVTLQRDAEFALQRANVLAQPMSVVALAQDKRKMADAARGMTGLRVIPDLTLAEALDALARPGSRVIAKRANGTEGSGLRVVETSDALRALAPSLDLDEYLFQPALEGHEYSVNLITDGRVCHVYRPVSKGTNHTLGVHPARRVRTFPAPLPDAESLRLMDLASRYALAIGAKGLLEVEFIESGRDIYLVEMNPRLSATLRMSISSSKVNLLGAMSRIIDTGLAAQQFVEPIAHSVEVPLPAGLSSSALNALFRLGNVQVSSRITAIAPTIDALADLRDRVSRVLDADGHARAAASVAGG